MATADGAEAGAGGAVNYVPPPPPPPPDDDEDDEDDDDEEKGEIEEEGDENWLEQVWLGWLRTHKLLFYHSV